MKNLLKIIILLQVSFLVGQTNFRGRIVDEQTKQPIQGAKVSVSDQGLGVLSNDLGYFVYSKYHKVVDRNSALSITAPGYEEIVKVGADIRQLFGSVSTIYLGKGKKKKEKKLNNAHIYWDVSSSVGNYDFEKTWRRLVQFLEQEQIKTINFTAFNTQKIAEKELKVSNQSLDELRLQLGQTQQNGLSNYNLISDTDTDAVVLVSNGNAVYGDISANGNIPFYSIMIGRDGNAKYLNQLAQFTDGTFLQASNGISSTDNRSIVTGIIKTESGPIQGASIFKKGGLLEYHSKADGSFEIPADDGDILTFSFLGTQTKSLPVENRQSPLAVYLEPLAELLDEIVLKEKRITQDNEVITGFGKESKDKLGYAVNYLTSEEIKPEVQFVSDILRGRFAGIIVNGFGSQATISIRNTQTFGGADETPTGSGGASPLWVIDNNQFQATIGEVNSFVDPQNIESISVLKSAAATVRFGTLGIDGVIIIRTKTGSARLSTDDPIVPSLLVSGNNYKENLPLLNLSGKQASYITELEGLNTVEEKYLRYKEMAFNREPSLSFYIDMAQYFQRYNQALANEILDKLVVVGNNNAKVLRVVAYMYEAVKAYDKARLMYERIVKLAPKEAQSYRDLAMIYQEVGEYNKALELYINMLGKQLKGINFTGLENSLKSELSRLIAHHKDKIEFQRLPNEWLRVGYNVDLRMVIEWSDRTVPFEFQFVNPNKKYYTWAHTLEDNKRRLYEEQDQGFQTEEFIVDDAPAGDWIVNIQYLGEKDQFNIPPYLKYTIYRNYGTINEQKEVKVIKLYQQNDKVTLSKIDL